MRPAPPCHSPEQLNTPGWVYTVNASSAATLNTEPRADFVETPYVAHIAERALGYVRAGFPVHFRGPAGIGKTTLALHVAHRLGRPVMLMVGDDEYGSSDLVGAQAGYRRVRVVDNFIQSVRKTEEDVAPQWVDNRLTIACREGLTLVYDEFTRSRPEANNALLSVLEEGVLVLPARGRAGTDYLRVHPDFNAIFTSNPAEYAGVHQAQDALFERMVTIDLDSLDEESETAIVRARSGVSEADALTIVRLVRAARGALAASGHHTVRSAIVIGCVLAQQGAVARAGDPVFEQTCQDVLSGEAGRRGWNGTGPAAVRQQVLDLILEFAGGPARRARPARARA
jgi:nitric oxide reductase NorQ protein